jgi:hypothetical protein
VREIREDRDFYIPDYLSEDPGRLRPEVWSAANDHAKELRDAIEHLDDAAKLARVLRASIQGEVDARAMQTDTVVKIIERELGEARACIGRHDARHMNLFMAYFDLKDRAAGAGGT